MFIIGFIEFNGLLWSFGNTFLRLPCNQDGRAAAKYQL